MAEGLFNTPEPQQQEQVTTNGMLSITPELEEAGRWGDTEVGRISKGSIVIPVPITTDTDPDIQEMMLYIAGLYEAFNLDFQSFVVTPENTEYATTEDAIEAHLTVDELVIPPQLLNSAKDLQSALADVFDVYSLNINQYIVGHEDNSINPETGLPEFFGGFVKKAFKKAKKAVSGVTKAVTGAVGSAFKNLGSLASAIGKAATKTVYGLGGLVIKAPTSALSSALSGAFRFAKGIVKPVVKLVDKAVANPYVQAIITAINPTLGQTVALYSKIDNGGKLTPGDLLTLGLTSATQAGAIKVSDAARKAMDVGTKIASGANPVQALAGTYGADFAKTLGLDTKLNTTLTETFGEAPANFVSEYLDVNQAAADLVAGKKPDEIVVSQLGDDIITFAGNKAIEGIGSTFGEENAQFFRDRLDIGQAAQDIMNGESSSRILANQFGDDLVSYIDSDSPNLQALGYAGIETAVAKAEGADTQQALTAGIKEYYNRDGGLPDVGSLGDITGVDWGSFDWNVALPDIGFDVPDIVGQGYDWLKDANIDFGNFDFQGFNFPDINMQLSQFADLGGSLGDLNFSGVDFGDIDLSLGELKTGGVDLNDISFGDFSFPEFATLATTVASGQGGPIIEGDTTVVSLENPLLKPKEEGPLLSRQLIESTPIGTA